VKRTPHPSLAGHASRLTMLPRNVPTGPGKSEHVLSVTSRAAIHCQYNAAGTVFWRTFLGTSCPGKIEVE
jgi:hypothetical protein